MQFLALSEKQLIQGDYAKISKNHILISIKDIGRKLTVPKSQYCKKMLQLEFNDEYEISNSSFNQDLARQIIDFVNSNCFTVDLIIVHCYAGLSRSVAVASALSKILNNKDDDIYAIGMPNMLVYTTILDSYYSEQANDKKWSSIFFKRNEAMKKLLSPAVYRMWHFRATGKGE